jgi:MFS family permease
MTFSLLDPRPALGLIALAFVGRFALGWVWVFWVLLVLGIALGLFGWLMSAVIREAARQGKLTVQIRENGKVLDEVKINEVKPK